MVEFSDREIEGFTIDNKSIRIDLRCRDTLGRTFIVEMQNAPFENFFRRCVHYTSQVYNSLIKLGDSDYDNVEPVYLIALMCSPLREPELISVPHGMVSHYTFMDVDTKYLAPNVINIIFARMNEARALPGVGGTMAEKLCYYLPRIGEMEDYPSEEKNDDIQKLFQACHIAGFSPEKRLKYEREMISIYDRKAIDKTIFNDGRKEGLAEGLAEGRANNRIENAVALIRGGISLDVIAPILNLSSEEIAKIRESI